MRKNIKGVIVSLLVSVGLIITSCGSNDTPSESATEAVAGQEEQTEQAVEEETVEDVQENEDESNTAEQSDTIQIGSKRQYTYLSSDGSEYDGNVNVEFLDINAQFFGELGYYGLYAELDVENNTNTEVYMQMYDGEVYVDNYQYNDDSHTIAVSSKLGFTADSFHINPGRKAKVVLLDTLDAESANNAERIEMEIMDGADTIIFKDNGEWLFGNDVQSNTNVPASSDSSANTVTTSGDGIGNPVIDSNPDRYIPEGVSGEIDVIDECFYADNGNTSAIAGEYLIIGGDATIIEISGSDGSGWTMSIRNSNKDDNEQLLLQPAENGSPSYWASSDNDFYTVSFFDGGMYVRTDSPDDENDWIEGFYEIL